MGKKDVAENGKGKPKKRKGCLTVAIIALALLAVFVGILVWVTQNADKLKPSADGQAQQSGIAALINAEQFSRISEEQLVELLGEPTEKEDWRNKTSDISGYDMTTYRYVDGDVCYEYNFTTNTAGEKPLVYMIILFDYTGEGSNLGVGLNADIFDRLGITPISTGKIENDTSTAIRWSSVSNSVYEVWAQDVKGDDKMADWIKVKFDQNFPL